MEEWRYFQGSGGNQPLTALELVDPDRLSLFRYGVLTWIDKDGFPFSVATDFLLSENGEILLKKPSAHPTMMGADVAVLFNHITGIPTGGYTDRRYMLVWGRVSEDKGFLKLHPEEVSEWDEKVLPFDKLCAAAVPQGKKYLESLQPSIDASSSSSGLLFSVDGAFDSASIIIRLGRSSSARVREPSLTSPAP